VSGRYRVSQLAEVSGVPATTVRYYESAGLLPAERTESGYRVFGDQALERLTFIRRAAKHVGLPLDKVRELLSVWEQARCTEVRAQLRPRIADRLREVTQQIAELNAFSGVLRDALVHLDELPDRSAPA
jgi:MerR family copper efflux transcriptional regulator